MVCLLLEKPVISKVKSAYTLRNFGQIKEYILCNSANMIMQKNYEEQK